MKLNLNTSYSSNSSIIVSIITKRTEIILVTKAPIAKATAKSFCPKKNKNIAGNKCKSATKLVAKIFVDKYFVSPNLKIVANKLIKNVIKTVTELG